MSISPIPMPTRLRALQHVAGIMTSIREDRIRLNEREQSAADQLTPFLVGMWFTPRDGRPFKIVSAKDTFGGLRIRVVTRRNNFTWGVRERVYGSVQTLLQQIDTQQITPHAPEDDQRPGS